MNEDDPKEPNEPKKKRDWDEIAGMIMKGLGMIFAAGALIVILVIGLALGACFLGK